MVVNKQAQASQAQASQPTPVELKRAADEWLALLGPKGCKACDVNSTERSEADFTPLEKAAVAMVAMGSSVEDVSSVLDLTTGSIQVLLKQRSAINLLCKLQDGLGLSPEDRIAKAANLAVSKQVALVNSDNEKIAGEAARYIIDQTLGKALQRSEIRSASLVIDATSIRAKYDAANEQLNAVREQRNALLEAKKSLPREVVVEALN